MELSIGLGMAALGYPLVWFEIVEEETSDLLDTELVSLRYGLCFLVFLFKESLDFFVILVKPALVFTSYWP